MGVVGQQRRVDADHRRSGSRPRLPAGRDADDRRVRRQPAGRQPVRGKPRRRRSEDRRAQVALPARAPPAVGSRHLVGAAADRRDDRRQAAQARGAADQAGLAVHVRSHHRPADLADSGSGGSAVGHGRREDGQDPADSDQAAAVLAHLREQERSDRLHAGAARAGAREPEAVPLGRDAVRSAGRAEQPAARRDQHRQHRRRRELAGRRGSIPKRRSSTRRRATPASPSAKYDEEEFQRVRPETQVEAQSEWPHPALGGGTELRPGPRPRRRCVDAASRWRGAEPGRGAAPGARGAARGCRRALRRVRRPVAARSTQGLEGLLAREAAVRRASARSI